MGEAERSAEAESFARAMRELKDRAGLSYGVLARRLHTSTSTLHRYCSGEAVPAEFAVVDRFARACGATQGEAVDLHRAWLLADARRRAGARAVPEASSEVPVVPVVPVVPEAPELREVPAASAVREPGRGRRRLPAGAAVAVGAAALAAGFAAWLLTGPPEPPGSAGRTGPDPGTPQAGPTATAPGTAPGTATAPGTEAPAEAAAPLRAAVRSHVWASGCDHAYLAEPGPSAVPPPPVEADAPAWATARGAVHAGTQIVEVTLHGTGRDSVVLQDLQVRVEARRTPPPWNVYRMSQGCGGALTPAGFEVNLDAPRPLARPVAGNDAGEAVAAPALPLRVSAAEPAVLRVQTTTTGCDCDWYLDLRWTSYTGSGTLRVDAGGRPWRISAAAPDRPVYGFAYEQGRWAR
ncbi:MULTISPECIES: helix-turn-helix transcriptional regulator [unclassified Streptomyces]|uniref:helix-turn-helix domain-containing protein n=1 Tax=unclassified Streptomyces TaxID=2593676 RepID=UPI0013A6A96A|nr:MULTISPECIES: helix-turn-helix transcriptional regulator [unclassified Streptomyces]